MSIENRAGKGQELEIETLKDAFASINALKFVLDINGSLDPNIDRNTLLRSQSNLVFRAIEGVYPSIDEIQVDGIVALHPEHDQREEHTYTTLEELEENLFELGKSHGFIEEI